MNKTIIGEIYLFEADEYQNLIQCIDIKNYNSKIYYNFKVIKNIQNSEDRIDNVYSVDSSHIIKHCRLLTDLEKIKYL